MARRGFLRVPPPVEDAGAREEIERIKQVADNTTKTILNILRGKRNEEPAQEVQQEIQQAEPVQMKKDSPRSSDFPIKESVKGATELRNLGLENLPIMKADFERQETTQEKFNILERYKLIVEEDGKYYLRTPISTYFVPDEHHFVELPDPSQPSSSNAVPFDKIIDDAFDEAKRYLNDLERKRAQGGFTTFDTEQREVSKALRRERPQGQKPFIDLDELDTSNLDELETSFEDYGISSDPIEREAVDTVKRIIERGIENQAQAEEYYENLFE